jgi:hypothetical protein
VDGYLRTYFFQEKMGNIFVGREIKKVWGELKIFVYEKST